MLKRRLHPAFLKHVYPVAYFALVCGACVAHNHLAGAFLRFFGPVNAALVLLGYTSLVLGAVVKLVQPEEFQRRMAETAKELRTKSPSYRSVLRICNFLLLVAGGYPFLGLFSLLAFCFPFALRRFLLGAK